jgi:hypothetical protein
MVTMTELRAANPNWFSRENQRFFEDRQYKAVNYRGKVYLAQETTQWSGSMGGGPKRYRWVLHPVEAGLKVGPAVEKDFDDLNEIRDWVKAQDGSGKPSCQGEPSRRAGTPKRDWGKLVHDGCGGFLNPPTHPEHDWSVRSVYGDTFIISLTSAAKEAWLDPVSKDAARAKLKEWKPLPLSDPRVQDWIHEVLGYFRGMYVGQDKAMKESWNASDLRHLPDADPVLNQDIHAGIHLIRRYYPQFKATAYDFQAAYWGKKPTRALVLVPQPLKQAGPPRLTR